MALARFSKLRWLAILCFFLCLITPAQAWGPHPEITQAALKALGTNDPLILQLGSQAQRLTNYAWMADYRRLPFEEPDEAFYADDYLIFPEATTHLDHILPEVRQTFRPYFKRALQALRTETPRNAARWIGSLLHFTEDTGSPPHAAQIRGELHTRMENWVDASLIRIDGYAPQLPGSSDEAALDGFIKRMDELIEFSKARARRLQVPATVGNRVAVEPLVLECALETSRVTADLLHSLGQLAQKPLKESVTLHGTISSEPPAGPLGRFPAKIVLEGTTFSTLADLSGKFEFRNLPPGKYELCAFRGGSGLSRVAVNLRSGETNDYPIALPKAPANLVRNGDFSLSWAKTDAPDCWYRTSNAWEGEIIPLKIGQRYRLAAKFKPGAKEEVVVRWTRFLPHAVPRTAAMPKLETRTLTTAAPEVVFTGAENLGLLQLILKSSPTPNASWDSISLVPIAAD